MSTAWVGLGANLADARDAVRDAISRLAAHPQLERVQASPLYASAPRDYEAQDDFVNAVVRFDTALAPLALLDLLQGIEQDMGRLRNGPRFGPRRIDLDLLLYDDVRLDQPRLTLPHPRMAERRFVLEPLTAIDPALVIPGYGPAAALLADCAGQRVTPLADDPA